MKVSIVTAILDSHEVVRRQLLHYEKMNLPEDVEVIFVDDGSNPPLEWQETNFNFLLYPTNDFRPWSEHVARNKGVRLARGENLILIDIDYVLPKEAIEAVRRFKGDKMNFKRRFGVLNESGDLIYDNYTLKSYGLLKKWRKVVYISGHKSQFAMRRDLFLAMGGYNEDRTGQAHPKGGGAGSAFIRNWREFESNGWASLFEETPEISMFPIGKFCGDINYNPFNLFHRLKR